MTWLGKRGRNLQVAGLAYFAVSADQRTTEESERRLLQYYGPLRRPFAELVHRGEPDALGEELLLYRRAGLDLLILMPTIPELDQLELLAHAVLPSLTTA